VKFAATVEAAMLALLTGPGAASGIGNAAALRETVDDLNIHQVATLSATQAAARALLGRLAPEPLEAETSSGGIIPGARERRLWESYKKLHRQMIDQFDDDFDSAFGKAFARAYEEASRGC
jgi:type VI secretion system protein ImpI/type VI secretion system protein